jgi:hypothetical protein
MVSLMLAAWVPYRDNPFNPLKANPRSAHSASHGFGSRQILPIGLD